jgi:hypothetical protein
MTQHSPKTTTAPSDGWVPMHHNFPGDQRYENVPHPDPNWSLWGEVGTAREEQGGVGVEGWTWSIHAMNDASDEIRLAGAFALTEAAAKAAVETWPQPNDDLTLVLAAG